MDRRTALKNMSITLGYAAVTPTILSVLQSCTSDVATWKPVFFTETESYMITHLSDIILPKTEIVGALDVHVAEFMDKMFDEVLEDEQKATMKEGATAFANEFKKVYSKEASKGTKDEFEKLLAAYFKIPDDQQQVVFESLNKDKAKLEGTELHTFLIYKFLLETRYYTLFGYYTSEEVGENILSYDPIPGVYLGCIPVENVGNAWSL